MLENDLTLRCWCHKQQESEHCNNHSEFPNLSVNAKEYGDDCHLCSMACSLHDFLERFYPDVDKGQCPNVLDDFLAYVKRMSRHDDLWQIHYNTTCDPGIAKQVKKIVGMLLPIRGDATAQAARVNHTLSDKGSQLRVEVSETGFAFVGDVEGARFEVARLSCS